MTTSNPLTVVITGANRGIGLALAKIYLGRGDKVYAVCRQSSPELEQTAANVVSGVDVSRPETLSALTQALGQEKIDLLINNAGILHAETLGDIDYTNITQQLEVNAVAPLRITETLVPYFAKPAKIGLITSRMGSIADNGSGSYYGYRMSKAALNAAGKSLAHDLKDRHISVAILHPGFVQTDMVNHAGDISAETAAERLSTRIDELSSENTGTFWHSNGDVLPW